MSRSGLNHLPGASSYRFGDLRVTALSDGTIDADLAILRGIDLSEAARLLREAGKPIPPRVSVNAYVLHLPTGPVLVDTGAGVALGPSLGRLQTSMRGAGINPDDIVSVLLTHAHPDHSNGLTDAQGHRFFAHAELVVHEKEREHWFDDAQMMKASPRQRQRNFEAVRFQFAPYLDRLRLFRAGEIIPDVQAVPLSGHTPGHSGYLVGTGKEALLIWGDTVHIPVVQIGQPDVSVVLDEDPNAAVVSRRRVLDMAASEGFVIAGMHVDFPGLARIHREKNGFAFEALARPDLEGE